MGIYIDAGRKPGNNVDPFTSQQIGGVSCRGHAFFRRLAGAAEAHGCLAKKLQVPNAQEQERRLLAQSSLQGVRVGRIKD
jgi:hypothetical protein